MVQIIKINGWQNKILKEQLGNFCAVFLKARGEDKTERCFEPTLGKIKVPIRTRQGFEA